MRSIVFERSRAASTLFHVTITRSYYYYSRVICNETVRIRLNAFSMLSKVMKTNIVVNGREQRELATRGDHAAADGRDDDEHHSDTARTL